MDNTKIGFTEPNGINPVALHKSDSSTISDLFNEVLETVMGPRQDTYGTPHNSFQQIADMWEAYLKRRTAGPIGPQDVANMMILMKVSRSATGKHHDSTVDIIGYAALKEII